MNRIHLLRDSCGRRSQVLCRYCGSSCSFRVYHILHQAPRTVRHPFDHLPEHRRVVRRSPSNCTGYDLSPPHVGNYAQLDEFTPKDVGLSWHPPHFAYLVMATTVASPTAIRAHRILPAFLLSRAATHNLQLQWPHAADRILMEWFLIHTCVVFLDVSVGMRHADGMNGSETLSLQDMPYMESFILHWV